MKRSIGKFTPVIVAATLTLAFFWQFFWRGYIPIPASFMVAWYEPWKSQTAVHGVPAIPHKAVGDDIFRQIYPFRTLARDSLLSGSLPLWNPYNGAGQPLLATLHTGIANPWSVLQIGDSKRGWAWFVILQMPLLYLGTYWFMKTIRVSGTGALTAGVVMALSGVATSRYIYGDYVYALIGLPFILACIEQKRLWAIPWIAAGVLVSVQPQISVYVLGTTVLYVWYRKREYLWEYGATLLLGVLLSSFQLFPTIELFRYANVTAGSSSFIFDKFLMPVHHLISVAVPNYFGNAGTYNFWGATDYIETVASIGMIPLTLIFFTRKGSIRNFFIVGTILTMLLTLDWFVPRLLYSLPVPILSTSIPTRIYLLTTFFVAVLAGMGMDEKPKIRVIIGMGLLGVLFLLVSRAFSCPEQIVSCANVALRNGLFEMVVFFIGSVFLFIPRIGKTCVVLLIVCAGMYNGWKILPMSPSEYVDMPNEVISQISRRSPGRVSTPFASDFGTGHRFFDTNYYDPLYIRRYGELVSFVNTGDKEKGLSRSDVAVVSDISVSPELEFRRSRFWDMTGTEMFVTKRETGTVSGTPAWSDDHWLVYNRPTSLPRAYLVDHVDVVTDPTQALQTIFSPQFDPALTALTETPIPGLVNPTQSTGSASIVRYSAGRVDVSTQSNGAMLLVLSDTFFPGWKATIDGKQSEIYRTNYTFRGVVIPKGKHSIVFSYMPLSFLLGFAVSVVASMYSLWRFGRNLS